MNILFSFYQKIICPHPTDYVSWVDDEWESWKVCTICNYDNLYSRLKAKLMPYKGIKHKGLPF